MSGRPASTTRRLRVWVLAAVLLAALLAATALAAFMLGRAQSPAAIEDAPREDREALSLYAEALSTAREDYVDRAAADPSRMTHGAIVGMLGTLGDDGHTRFLTAEAMKETRQGLSGSYVGVGVELEEEEGAVVVAAPLAGSPAERAGVRPGDVVTGVGPWDAGEAGVDEVVARIQGEEGTRVALKVERERSGRSLERGFVLQRQQIDAPAAAWAKVPATDAAVVSLSSFTEDAAEELAASFSEARESGAKSFVLDLRGNPGGELEEAVSAAGLFLRDGGVVYVRQDADGKRQRVEVADPTPFSEGPPPVEEPVAVLVDGGSASSAEILAGALRDNQRARLIGQRTAGTGTVLSEFPLSDGSSILLGVAEWLTPGGDFIRESGIEPDVGVPLGEGEALAPSQIEGMEPGEAPGEDPELARALVELDRAEADLER